MSASTKMSMMRLKTKKMTPKKSVATRTMKAR